MRSFISRCCLLCGKNKFRRWCSFNPPTSFLALFTSHSFKTCPIKNDGHESCRPTHIFFLSSSLYLSLPLSISLFPSLSLSQTHAQIRLAHTCPLSLSLAHKISASLNDHYSQICSQWKSFGKSVFVGQRTPDIFSLRLFPWNRWTWRDDPTRCRSINFYLYDPRNELK